MSQLQDMDQSILEVSEVNLMKVVLGNTRMVEIKTCSRHSADRRFGDSFDCRVYLSFLHWGERTRISLHGQKMHIVEINMPHPAS